MPLLQQAPRFDTLEAAAIARTRYGLDGEATGLTSERDQNFLLHTPAGARFVLKIANGREERPFLEAQNAAMAHVRAHGPLCPRVVPALNGEEIVDYESLSGRHFARLLTWIEGETLGTVRWHSPPLLEDLGRRLGEMDRALATFDHPAIHRAFYWDLGSGLDTVREHSGAIADEALRARVRAMAADVERRTGHILPALRRSAIHGDANDHNVVVADRRPASEGPRGGSVAGFIDFGDMVHGITVADLAIAIAYVVLDKPNPLAAARLIVGGYYRAHPLTDDELSVLFDLVRLRLCMSVAIAAHQQAERPDDQYLGVSQAPIERTLPGISAIPPRFAEASFRQACGLDPVPSSARIATWLATRAVVAPVVDRGSEQAIVLDLSVGSPLLSADAAGNNEPALTARIANAMSENDATVAIGRYGEPRLLYTAAAFAGVNEHDEHRTIHLGIDIFAPPRTPVHAPLDGVVLLAGDNAAPLDYGPVIILTHLTEDGVEFYSLYGHLTRESLEKAIIGRQLRAGEAFAAIGTADVNGGWTPHLHFQLITDLLDLGRDYPGVCRASEREVWEAFSPDPGVVVGATGATFPDSLLDTTRTLDVRRERIGRNVRVGYRDPVKVVRGWKQFLFDVNGRCYLDAYNNVPHVGHSHPRVVRAVAEQLRVLNTNTRYLHDALQLYAERLAATLPAPLRVCYFVNSGSEANELALRLARAHTHRRDVIVLESAYHGNTTTLIDISPYKFNGPGGEGAPPWVHVVPVPDLYRGMYRQTDPDAASKYAEYVADTIAALQGGRPGLRVSAFIAETCPSVAGQIVLPHGYLPEVYARVRAGGGLCIADEVQTAYGRIGTHFYAFEAHGVVPDIVVLGKPVGNGYPIGAVVTTPQIAASFDNGMEFFSTFGGSTAACAAGLAVLDVIEEEQLQAHARRVGDVLLAGLRGLADRHGLVGDVRGSGLFLGVELVKNRRTLEPAAAEASYVVNRLRDEAVLIGTDGPLHNVLKIRPPMPFDESDAGRLVETLDRVLGEIG